MSKPWYTSKTKIGGVLLGISTITGGIGGVLVGDIDLSTALIAVAAGISAILIATGIRDALSDLE